MGGERAWLIRDTQGEDNRESFQCLWWISLPDLEQNLLLSSEQNQLLSEFADESTNWLCFRSDLITKNIHILFKIIICSERLQQCIAICQKARTCFVCFIGNMERTLTFFFKYLKELKKEKKIRQKSDWKIPHSRKISELFPHNRPDVLMTS